MTLTRLLFTVSIKLKIHDKHFYLRLSALITFHTLILNQPHPYQINEIVVVSSRVKPQIPISFSRISFSFFSTSHNLPSVLLMAFSFLVRANFSYESLIVLPNGAFIASLPFALLERARSFNREHANRFFKPSIYQRFVLCMGARADDRFDFRLICENET